MTKKPNNYPAPSELDQNQVDLANLKLAKTTLERIGLEAPVELMEKINEVSSQTRENLPKWVTDPKWIEQLEDLRTRLIESKKILEGGKTKRLELQLRAIQYQLDKVEKVLNNPKDYLPEGMSRKEYAQKIGGIKETTRRGARELSPEEKEQLLSKLKTRFENNMNLHQGINWADVKASLESTPEALKSLALMEAAGHEPDLYYTDNNDYFFGTCSKESPQSGRNLNYSKSVEQANTMGITLMSPEEYQYILQKNGEFDFHSSTWLLTPNKDLSLKSGLYGCAADGGGAFMSFCNFDLKSDRFGWRGSLRVKKA